MAAYIGAGAGRKFSPDAPPTRFSLGRLAPLALLLWCALDLGLRFVPEEWLRIEPVQVATRLPAPKSPFTPGLKINVEGGAGEQALMGNLRPTEVQPPMSFTTDGLGFRWTPARLDAGPPRVVFFKGDSFTFGGALSDEDTLPAALSARLGVGVYNAGRFFTDEDGVRQLDELLVKLGADRPAVVCLYLESHERRFLSSYAEDVRRGRDGGGVAGRVGTLAFGERRYAELRESVREARRRYGAWWNISPLKIASIRAYKRLYNGSLLPNQAEDRVEARRLPNGERILLNPEKLRERGVPPDERLMRRTVEYFIWMDEHFRSRGMNFWVVLVPDKETVYASQLAGDQSGPPASSEPLSVLEAELARRDIRVLNAATALRRTAAEDWAAANLTFYREDHHWNPRGVSVVADALAEAMRRDGWGAGGEASGGDLATGSGGVRPTANPRSGRGL